MFTTYVDGVRSERKSGFFFTAYCGGLLCFDIFCFGCVLQLVSVLCVMSLPVRIKDSYEFCYVCTTLAKSPVTP